MHNKLFVFFGCSWTFGKNISWSNENFEEISSLDEKKLADQFAYRSLIAKHFLADQQNFSEGGSSNSRQFRYASEYFLGEQPSLQNRIKFFAPEYLKLRMSHWPTLDQIREQKSLPDYIIDEFKNIHNMPLEFLRRDTRKKYVIWFITSTARNEFYNSTLRCFENFFYKINNSDLAKILATDYYDHNYEVEKLTYSMKLWNSYFALNNIQNVWIDTFNHHDNPIPNKIKFDSEYSDILSNLAIQTGLDFQNADGHLSDWVSDDDRSTHLVNQGLLNKKSIHPTIEGHKQISELIIPKLEKFFAI